ncbi:hypothetical protein LINGRAHAP2_LOCUS14701 [Linum grandiflorum]
MTCTLNGKNFTLWSRCLRIALKTRKKLGYIDGTIPPPALNDARFEDWDQSNIQVLGWILNSLEALAKAREYQAEDYVMRFIKGLNDDYEGVRTNLLMMKPMPSITAAFSYVL